MTDQFFRIVTDPEARDRWYLRAPVDADGNEIDPRLFTEGHTINQTFNRLRIPLRQEGRPVDFNFADFGMIVTPQSLNEKIAQLTGDEVQRVPVAVEGNERSLEILNATRLIDCVDEERSIVEKWTAADGRPDRIGDYRMVARTHIHADLARGRHLFRLKGWEVALIASHELKKLIESLRTTGCAFQPVG